MKRLILLTILIVSLLTACGASNLEITQATQIAEMQEFIMSQATATNPPAPTALPTYTPMPTYTPFPSPTVLPTDTPEPTVKPPYICGVTTKPSLVFEPAFNKKGAPVLNDERYQTMRTIPAKTISYFKGQDVCVSPKSSKFDGGAYYYVWSLPGAGYWIPAGRVQLVTDIIEVE